MEHHQDNDVSARASNELPNEQLGLWVIQMHYWELQPVVNQSHPEKRWVVTQKTPFLHEYSWSRGLRCPPVQDQCPEPSFPLPFQQASYPVQRSSRKYVFQAFKEQKANKTSIYSHDMGTEWSALHAFWSQAVFSQRCCISRAVLSLNLHNKHHHHLFPKVIFTFLPSLCSLIQRKVDKKMMCLGW